jgi:hypothetical protein
MKYKIKDLIYPRFGVGYMVDKHISFVTTTINKPEFIEGYLKNISEYDHSSDRIEFLVVGDLKTPLHVRKYCTDLSDKYEVGVRYLGVEDQIEWLEARSLEDLGSYLPYNSIQRRNIGYLQACERGADVIVSLDDDNLARDDDIAGDFATVGEKQEVFEVSAPNNWYNCASMLEYENEEPRDIYHRGFPYSKRDEEQEYSFIKKEHRVMIRAGLWLDVPDIDVITHLERGPRATALRDEFDDKLVALGDDTYCPVNTQNTAFHTDLMPLIHTIPMGDTIEGMEISRFDDIWLGFFAEKILHNMDGTVAYGTPISTHDRNTHNLKEELEHEAVGIRLNEMVVDILENIEISGSSYNECYKDLIRKYRTEMEGYTEYSFEAYFKRMLDGMELWAGACQKVLE